MRVNQLLTLYAEKLNPDELLQEYPRPQLKRSSYLNLNGYWDFHMSTEPVCHMYDRKILVPFSPESILSGINEILYPNMYAYYQKEVMLEQAFVKDLIILHFGAVDQRCDLFVNDHHVLTHVGGYTPFSVDITPYIKDDLKLKINLSVTDSSDTSYHLTGKQRLNHEGIFYTPQSGIWQTVWLESVSKDYLKDITIKPLYDQSAVFLEVFTDHFHPYIVHIYNHDNELIKTHAADSFKTIIELDSFIPWTPENPYLYNVEIIHGNDVISSYFGMRIFERKKDHNEIMRFYLNHQPYFQSGVLDQGYYSDGLLTAPSDQALIDDIMTMKSLGFNMIRKHIKIESLRWYYHCDRLGMLVWQDMISGSEFKSVVFHHVLSLLHIHLSDRFKKLFGRTNAEGKRLYENDLRIMLNHLKNVTSICTWVPFNEAWGQFDTVRITKLIGELDDTRLIDHASGWSDHGVGDYYSRHMYYQKIRFYKRLAKKRIASLTEYGGYSLPIEGHRYNNDKLFGYKSFETKEAYQKALEDLFVKHLMPNLDKGLSVLVYTQLSDVEDEVNGLVTYDRRILKVDERLMQNLNSRLYSRFKQIMHLDNG
jgi:beta-galactosidase/beta-glucuronidase